MLRSLLLLACNSRPEICHLSSPTYVVVICFCYNIPRCHQRRQSFDCDCVLYVLPYYTYYFHRTNSTQKMYSFSFRTSCMNLSPIFIWHRKFTQNHMLGNNGNRNRLFFISLSQTFNMIWVTELIKPNLYVQWPLLLTWFNFNPSMDK